MLTTGLLKGLQEGRKETETSRKPTSSDSMNVYFLAQLYSIKCIIDFLTTITYCMESFHKFLITKAIFSVKPRIKVLWRGENSTINTYIF